MTLPPRPTSLALLAGALALGLVIGAGTAAANGDGIGEAKQSPAAPPAAFAQCAGCHSLEPGKHLFGPSLALVAGRKAGSVPDYTYSEALKQSGLIWNAETLDTWLIAPKDLVPGTKMPFMGLPDTQKRKAIVTFLTERD